ncbi:VG15 protein, partial [Nocardioides sp. URHA0032]|uniref:VG15 protein n=1 Tax=Nocardioides sp. URHA0032 TaxID=1380388 RepID=UPI0005604881
MALEPRALTLMHRRQQLALRKSTVAQMEDLWPALDWADLDRSFPGFAAEALRVVSKNRRTSSGLAAGYLRAFRVASGLSGDVRIIVPQMPAEQFATSLRVTSLIAAKKAAANGVPVDVAMSNALTQSSGAMARLVLNAGRDTVTQTIRSDPKARGWERVLGGGGCDFCQMLAGRVYPRDNAGFDAHDHCGCTAEPAY